MLIIGRAVSAAGMTDEQLYDANEGCGDVDCIYHGILNAEIRKRGLPRFRKSRDGGASDG